MKQHFAKNLPYLIPTFGIINFFIFYYITTIYYPGGWKANRTMEGFNWVHNYSCTLLDPYAYNGKINAGRVPAMIASLSLCIGVGSFFYLFPRYFAMRKFWKITVQIVGVLSMSFMFFLFTPYHDMLLNVAGTLGGIAIIGTMVALRRNSSFPQLWAGAACIFLLLVNGYIYYSGVYVEYLPLIQMFSLLIVFTWFIHVNLLFLRVKQR